MDLCEMPNFDQFTVLMIQEKILSASGQWQFAGLSDLQLQV
jgi:hypothetical protein